MFDKPHIQLAQSLWKEHLSEGDLVIDATCGNGHDTRFLAQLVGEDGAVVGYDIQPKAIEQTRQAVFDQENVSLKQKCHSQFEENKVSLIVYNLGYLPKGNKNLTTTVETTLSSLKQALEILKETGAISLTCYPGHLEGEKEEKAILEWLTTLPSHHWLIRYTQWPNRLKAPSHIWIQKRAPAPS